MPHLPITSAAAPSTAQPQTNVTTIIGKSKTSDQSALTTMLGAYHHHIQVLVGHRQTSKQSEQNDAECWVHTIDMMHRIITTLHKVVHSGSSGSMLILTEINECPFLA
jgi:hypothetical protein